VLNVDSELRAALEAFADVLHDNVLVHSVKYEALGEMEVVTLGDKQVGIYISA
jgi:isoleucyl-tRNA synthetase